MKISYHLLLAGITCLMPFASIAQEVVPYVASGVKVDWVHGTDFSKYKTYAWGATNQENPDPSWKEHLIEHIDAVLKTKGLQKVGTDQNPSLIVAYSTGGKLEYSIQDALSVVKQGNLLVELADPQMKKAVWWALANEKVTDKHEKDFPTADKIISKMFAKYPPPGKK